MANYCLSQLDLHRNTINKSSRRVIKETIKGRWQRRTGREGYNLGNFLFESAIRIKCQEICHGISFLFLNSQNIFRYLVWTIQTIHCIPFHCSTTGTRCFILRNKQYCRRWKTEEGQIRLLYSKTVQEDSSIEQEQTMDRSTIPLFVYHPHRRRLGQLSFYVIHDEMKRLDRVR